MPVLDATALAIIPRQATRRLGSWLNQELYGGPTSLPWGLKIYQRVDKFGRIAPATGTSTGEVLAVVYPMFLYETVWNVLTCLVIVWVDRKSKMDDGHVFALYVAAYILGRFFIELMHVNNATLIFGVCISNIMLLVVLFCAVITLWILRAKSREIIAEVRGEREVAGAHNVFN